MLLQTSNSKKKFPQLFFVSTSKRAQKAGQRKFPSLCDQVNRSVHTMDDFLATTVLSPMSLAQYRDSIPCSKARGFIRSVDSTTKSYSSELFRMPVMEPPSPKSRTSFPTCLLLTDSGSNGSRKGRNPTMGLIASSGNL